MTSDLTTYMKECKKLIDGELNGFISQLEMPSELKEAMLYSVDAGGKRIRPILMLATAEAFGASKEKAFHAASAVEMIHTYSLIHDDLPAMDDDDLRRGKPTNHKVFGEAIAILAGDALLTQSFEVISDSLLRDDQKVKLITLMARAAGPSGMVGGQIADLSGEEQELTLEELEYIHHHKTGKLLVYSILAGAVIGDATDEQMSHLKQFGEHLGLAFQISDDILDVEGDQEKIGKLPGSDETNKKSTYPKLLTLEGAKNKLASHYDEALLHLAQVGVGTDRLRSLAKFIIERDH
ncbi:polyprenyl synthetase family protein [Alkalihalobacillus sp. CinArs1]|uniref:polyprenyl synthetase family protein n=1 Tax=Alkalihalobacillus sp. CinArs1 TaxID=2995314 RepID=UPI0022DCEF24|nr:farnesyl diphosphate synthase [Alkalihalobacillus sp. CinArs1]